MSYLLEQKRLHETNWSLSYNYFSKIINKFKLKTGVEIGVAFGGHCEAILNKTKITKLYGIDAYQHRQTYRDVFNLPQEEFNRLFQYTSQRLRKFGRRFRLIRKTSQAAVKYIPDNLDFVYMDANHSFNGVLGDLSDWFFQIKDGGIIGGHDYGHVNHPGVKKAVDQFFNRFHWPINLEPQGVWWVQKQPLNVSFFIPAFNCQKTIKSTVDSIIKTNFQSKDELIIVNDGSTDKTHHQLKLLKQKYPFIKVINHQNNRGGGCTRNAAVDVAKHQFLFCLDADNILAPKSITKLKDFLIQSNADVVSFQSLYYFKTSPQKTTHKWKFKPGLFTLSDALSGLKNPGSSGNYLFTKRSWIQAGGYPEFTGALDAWGFSMRQLFTGVRMIVMPKSYYYHRWGYDSYWVREARKGKMPLTALQTLLPYIHLLNPRDVNYIMSKKGRYNWFGNLKNHPIRLKKTPSKTWSRMKSAMKKFLSL